MNASDLLWRSEWFASAASNLIVLGLCIGSYRQRPRRSVLLIALGAGVAFVCVAAQWIAETPSKGFWALLSVANIGASAVSVAGMYRLLAEISGWSSTSRPAEERAP